MACLIENFKSWVEGETGLHKEANLEQVYNVFSMRVVKASTCTHGKIKQIKGKSAKSKVFHNFYHLVTSKRVKPPNVQAFLGKISSFSLCKLLLLITMPITIANLLL